MRPDKPQTPAAGSAGSSRLRWLLIAGVCLLLTAVVVNRESLQLWVYSRLPLETVADLARHRPDDVLLARAAGGALLSHNRASEGRALLAPALERHPEDVSLQVLTAQAEFQGGSPQRAGQLLHAVLEREPAHAEARYWMAEFLHHQGYEAESRELLLEVTRLEPSRGAAWQRLGELSLNAEHYAEALDQLDHAARLSPSADVSRSRAQALKALGRLPEAEQAARDAVAREPSREALDLLGEIVAAPGTPERLRAAYPFFRQAAELPPVTSDALNLLAVNLRAQGRHAEAVQVLRRMLRASPAMSQGYLLLGQSYQALGKKELAARVLRTYARLEPLETRVSRARYQSRVRHGSVESLLALARVYLEVGRQDLAGSTLERVLRRSPESAEARTLLAQAQGPPTLKIDPLPPDPAGDAG